METKKERNSNKIQIKFKRNSKEIKKNYFAISTFCVRVVCVRRCRADSSSFFSTSKFSFQMSFQQQRNRKKKKQQQERKKYLFVFLHLLQLFQLLLLLLQLGVSLQLHEHELLQQPQLNNKKFFFLTFEFICSRKTTQKKLKNTCSCSFSSSTSLFTSFFSCFLSSFHFSSTNL